ncbi:MAG: c-type cytochrome [Deltaproteobacteria bacterium]|nr:c-type cytochrome [Deltaproteobacteria bacterium]
MQNQRAHAPSPRLRRTLTGLGPLFGALAGLLVMACGDDRPAPVAGPCAPTDGQCIFRHDTFGDEQLWTDVLRLHELAQTLPPTTALAVGLKVDAEAVPAEVLASADLADPATTVALIGLNAVVGLRGVVENGTITKLGITCALCHSTVDDSVAPGIGRRLDGWPNRDLDSGAILALTPGLPTLAATLAVDPGVAKTALQSWGAGRYDARFNQDTESHPVLLPPAYGLRDVALETYTGEGEVSYWNAYVAVTQMGGHGNFKDDRVGLDIRQEPDRVTPMLPALRDYQFSLVAPPPPAGSFDAAAAARGQLVFAGKAQCASCHAGASFTDAPTLHAPEETGMDANEARRSATGKYRTTPLRGAWQHPPYFHDGSAATLADVVVHYDGVLGLQLTPPERADLEQYLRSL